MCAYRFMRFVMALLAEGAASLSFPSDLRDAQETTVRPFTLARESCRGRHGAHVG